MAQLFDNLPGAAFRFFSRLVTLILLAGSIGRADPPIPKAIDFNRDVRPILADNCYKCHGPDKNKRKADLRLDTRHGIFSKTEPTTVVPGEPEKSELYRRLTSMDETERMPKPGSGKALSSQQIEIIEKWIKQGAPWKGHWAYERPIRPEVPRLENDFAAQNAIDHFVWAKLKEVGVQPSPAADAITLCRRLHFDVTGLPPTKGEVESFVAAGASDAAYHQMVDRLLASPHFGERMAVFWLDLARYADSIGYHSDNPVSMSPYRDYVIAAFNANKPFDQFTIEQLAGDLLPRPGSEQLIASGYNRLLMTTEEGGAQPKEYEAKYAADRVRNASSVWLAATMGCAQCHDHKFDPYTQRDFYRLASFFADVQEVAVGRREPGMPVPRTEQTRSLQRIDHAIAELRARMATSTPRLTALFIARGFVTPFLDPALGELALLAREKTEVLHSIPTTLVSRTGPPRTLRILPRGNWLDDSGEMMRPGVPEALAPSLPEGIPTRLHLARWIVSRDNPLTARVFVKPAVEAFLRRGTMPVDGRFRLARRGADPSRTARLAGG